MCLEVQWWAAFSFEILCWNSKSFCCYNNFISVFPMRFSALISVSIWRGLSLSLQKSLKKSQILKFQGLWRSAQYFQRLSLLLVRFCIQRKIWVSLRYCKSQIWLMQHHDDFRAIATTGSQSRGAPWSFLVSASQCEALRAANLSHPMPLSAFPSHGQPPSAPLARNQPDRTAGPKPRRRARAFRPGLTVRSTAA